jgi:hypothetical protein
MDTVDDSGWSCLNFSLAYDCVDTGGRSSYGFVVSGPLVRFRRVALVLERLAEPTFGDQNWHVRIRIQADEELIESGALSLIYTLGMLSFHDARTRGVSGQWFEAADQWSAADRLRHLEFRRAELHSTRTTFAVGA